MLTNLGFINCPFLQMEHHNKQGSLYAFFELFGLWAALHSDNHKTLKMIFKILTPKIRHLLNLYRTIFPMAQPF